MSQPTLSYSVLHLYPRVLSVAGDRGNLMALLQRSRWRGIEVAVTEVEVGQDAECAAFDLILFHGGQDREMGLAAADLSQRRESLQQAADSDVVILAVCAGLQLLGHYYEAPSGERLEGVGILDLHTKAGPSRFMNHIAIRCDFAGGEARTLVGFENHSGRTYLGPQALPLGLVLAGHGNNGEDSGEGARSRQIYASYLHGPLLPKNPWLADHLIAMALRHRYREEMALDPLPDALEERAHRAALETAYRSDGRGTALPATSWKPVAS